jgi:hypothetical protein
MTLSEPGSIRPRAWRLCSKVQNRTKKKVYARPQVAHKSGNPSQTESGAIHVTKLEEIEVMRGLSYSAKLE